MILSCGPIQEWQGRIKKISKDDYGIFVDASRYNRPANFWDIRNRSFLS